MTDEQHKFPKSKTLLRETCTHNLSKQRQKRKELSIAASKFYAIFYNQEQFLEDCRRVELGQLTFLEDKNN